MSMDANQYIVYGDDIAWLQQMQGTMRLIAAGVAPDATVKGQHLIDLMGMFEDRLQCVLETCQPIGIRST